MKAKTANAALFVFMSVFVQCAKAQASLSVVITGVDGNPIPDADVTVFSPPPSLSMTTFRTGHDGTAIVYLNQSSAVIVAAADGFCSHEVAVTTSIASPVYLRLIASRSVEGRVVDFEGNAIAKATVLAVVASEQNRQTFYENETVAYTDESGWFKMRHIPAEGGIRFVTIPADSAPVESAEVEIDSRGREPLDLRIPAHPKGGVLRGRVFDSRGQSVAASQVRVSMTLALSGTLSGAALHRLSLAGLTEKLVMTDSQGYFTLPGVPIGTISIRARNPDLVSEPLFVDVTEQGILDVAIPLFPRKRSLGPPPLEYQRP